MSAACDEITDCSPVHRSWDEVSIDWKCTPPGKYRDAYFEITVTSSNTGQLLASETHPCGLRRPDGSSFIPSLQLDNDGGEYAIPDELVLTLSVIRDESECESKQTIARERFSTVYTTVEVARLYKRAVKRATDDESLKEFHYLTHCSTAEVFATGRLEAQLIRKCGHDKNPINHRLQGIFFFTNLMRFDSQSFFRPFRRIFEPKRVFGRFGKKLRVFFADYYCYGGSHRTCIVVCREGTEPYKFCQRYLKELDAEDNPFLCISRNPFGDIVGFKINHKDSDTNKAFTEIVYTEDLDLRELEEVQYTPASGHCKAGCSRCDL
ncbi:Protein M01B2.12 [Aphelenchoides avenae]|nr:Protein M01B2.12 [Aphelenchus avenae]